MHNILINLIFGQVVKKTESSEFSHTVARYSYMDQRQNVSTPLSRVSEVNVGKETQRIRYS